MVFRIIEIYGWMVAKLIVFVLEWMKNTFDRASVSKTDRMYPVFWEMRFKRATFFFISIFFLRSWTLQIEI